MFFDTLAVQVIEWGDFVQPVLEFVLELILPVLLGAVAIWVKGLIAKVKAELEASKFAFLLELAPRLVQAAEQLGIIGELEDLGEAKKAWVIAELQKLADANGISVSVETLAAIVEAAFVDVFGFSEREPSEEPVG